MRPSNTVSKTSAVPRWSKVLYAVGAAATMLCAASSTQAQGITLNFSATGQSEILFDNGTFGFTPNVPSGSNQFVINTGGTGAADGLLGNITPGGPFTINTITSQTFAGITVQTAPVTGSGTVYITDASSLNLTGAIQWENITTTSSAGGGAGVIDLTGMVNLTGITYSGANVDLQTLAAAGSAEDVVTFQFTSGETLTDLKAETGPGIQTSYSGTITAVPEPSILALIGMGLSAVTFARRRK